MTPWRLIPLDETMAELIAALHQISFAEVWAADSIKTILRMPGVFGYTAISNGVPVAFVMARHAGGEGEILSLATHPSVQRQGAARVLIKAALTELQAQACEVCFLEVAKDNIAAISLYHSYGFESVATRRDYYRPKPSAPAIDALILRYILGNHTDN